MPTTFDTIVPGLTFTEGPRWHDGRIYFSDLYTFKVQSARGDGSDLRDEATVPNQPSGLGWLPDGRLLIVSMMDKTLLRREADGTVVVHADLSHHVGGFLGDLIVDEFGRAYLGDFGFDLYAGEDMRPGFIHRVDPDGTITRVAEDLWFPNGCVINADNVMLVNETFGNRITAFDLTESGELINRRVWASFGPLPTSSSADDALKEVTVAPDGSCIDSEGGVWLADIRQDRLHRVVDGTIVESVDPGSCVFACALGGDDGHTLFFCATPDFDVETRKAARDSSIVSMRVGIPSGR
ncbi:MULTISPECIES: SMP-30/gluconolactonase/LRE family protein [unclassified Rhodococcus (in: high G+C Gram-positive bacteria)]|uniref:SMP-30/gluconolactonase/LRE family protein n=1 Tax=unclassified Rhodococcus (in: high G+C Gram-positive bacteria) TaxID=192944 RepID=UPI000AA18A9C|nr:MULTISPECIES: SMP-30/gluconolactonase/LRE family protein [unclassified Rhodococcus (in: high G+C Gram-positive bacteria)]